MKKTNSYPLQLVKVFRAGEITRQAFMQAFSSWQKSNGINFACKGSADQNGVYITYRGIKAAIRNGLLCWKDNTANSVFEFRRKVDFSLNARNDGGAKWN